MCHGCPVHKYNGNVTPRKHFPSIEYIYVCCNIWHRSELFLEFGFRINIHNIKFSRQIVLPFWSLRKNVQPFCTGYDDITSVFQSNSRKDWLNFERLEFSMNFVGISYRIPAPSSFVTYFSRREEGLVIADITVHTWLFLWTITFVLRVHRWSFGLKKIIFFAIHVAKHIDWTQVV